MVEDLPALPDSERLTMLIADTLSSHGVHCPDLNDYQRESSPEKSKLDNVFQYVGCSNNIVTSFGATHTLELCY